MGDKMKKTILILSLLCVLFLVTGCRRATPTDENPIQNNQEETPDNTDTTTENQEEEYTLDGYFPYQPNTEYIYEGEGNEYASYRVYMDYYDQTSNRIQIRTNNGGTELVRVLENTNDKLAVIFSKEEFYYRDNLLEVPNFDENSEILLMEPLVVGTEWNLTNDRRRYISNIDVEIETPIGIFNTIEVTTEGNDGLTTDYYAFNVGHVKSIFIAEDMEITSTLSEMNTEVPFTQLVEFYYADSDEKIYPEQKSLSHFTNDITRNAMEEAMKEPTVRETFLPLMSQNTKINSMYRGDDNIAYIDFSSELVTDMNAGSGYESLIMQSITNTIGNYYGVEEVYITIDQKPYESGHIVLNEGETFQVNMDLVVR